MRIISPVWIVCVAMLGASALFSVGVQKKKATLSTSAPLKTGDLVTLAAIVDGDSLVVKNADGFPLQLRILGIKSFEARRGQDEEDRIGKQAVDTLSALLQGTSVRVILGSPAKDNRDRYLATLLLHDSDVGLELVKRGLALVYTPYPFPAMPVYLQAQSEARENRIGLWASEVMVERSNRLMLEWTERAP